MTVVSKPLWSEGMLVRPQHFQQYDRWIESLVEGRVGGLSAFGWGVRRLVLASELLPLGRFALRSVSAVMPDGTVIETETGLVIEPRAIAPQARNVLVKLAVGLRALGGETGNRYQPVEQMARDVTAPERQPVSLMVGQLAVRLLLDGEAEDGTVTLPIARIAEVDAAGAVILDESYIPPCLDAHASPRLMSIVEEIRALLRSRAETLAGQAETGVASTESARLVDLIALTVINGQEAVFDHFATTPGLHPEPIYRAALALAGQLSTFHESRRREDDFPAYRHLALDGAFRPVLDRLRQWLTVVVSRTAVALPLEDRGYGVRTAAISDRTLFQDARFVLIAMASMPAETVRSQLPVSLKIGSVDVIRDLVNLQLPGLPLRALPAAPRELPFMQGAVYFELDRTGELWRGLVRSAAFAFHVSGDYPDLHLEFWAIRGKRP
ncbi:type VI secretion system baseplate subunit TssK [Methylobacterium sp. NFXW15]|uniref:type VI secretion system baseplate subunit TssK n=1 Tax=Methylobacterium sp. NFXW15 TaxID=2819512 RepID=UPI003CF69DAC